MSDDVVQKLLELEAQAREQLHEFHASSRPLSPDYELIGLIGECEFSVVFHQPLNLLRHGRGDGGIDFVLPLAHSVDVKTYRKPFHLIEEEGKVVADLYVLAGYSDETRKAALLGWEWGRVLKSTPVRDFGHGILNHHIPRGCLRPISQLAERIMYLKTIQ